METMAAAGDLWTTAVTFTTPFAVTGTTDTGVTTADSTIIENGIYLLVEILQGKEIEMMGCSLPDSLGEARRNRERIKNPKWVFIFERNTKD